MEKNILGFGKPKVKTWWVGRTGSFGNLVVSPTKPGSSSIQNLREVQSTTEDGALIYYLDRLKLNPLRLIRYPNKLFQPETKSERKAVTQLLRQGYARHVGKGWYALTKQGTASRLGL